MRKENLFLYLIIFAISYFYNVLNMVQISEKQFFANYVDNTTHLELYNDNTANIFLNNYGVHSTRTFLLAIPQNVSTRAIKNIR